MSSAHGVQEGQNLLSSPPAAPTPEEAPERRRSRSRSEEEEPGRRTTPPPSGEVTRGRWAAPDAPSPGLSGPEAAPGPVPAPGSSRSDEDMVRITRREEQRTSADQDDCLAQLSLFMLSS